jgi:hypothetical protein
VKDLMQLKESPSGGFFCIWVTIWVICRNRGRQ